MDDGELPIDNEGKKTLIVNIQESAQRINLFPHRGSPPPARLEVGPVFTLTKGPGMIIFCEFHGFPGLQPWLMN